MSSKIKPFLKTMFTYKSDDLLVYTLKGNVVFPLETYSNVMIIVRLLNTLLWYQPFLKQLEKHASRTNGI